MPQPGVKKRKNTGGQLPSSPELLEVSRQLAGLAVAQHQGPLTHRQREELRRALATAGNALGWSDARAGGEDPVAAATLDVIALTNSGVESLEQELAEERVRKQTEIARLGEAVAYARELAGNSRAVYPAEIAYSYTARDSFQGLITKTATSTVSEPGEALGVAVALQKSIESRSKLTDLMVVDLEERRGRLRDMKRHVPDFAQYARDLLGEVIANLT